LKKAISKFLLNLHGWKITRPLPEGMNKCVIIACPHTSNWDFYYTRMAFFALDIPMRFTIKSTYVKPPLSWIFGPLGAIAIKRETNAAEAKRKSYVDVMADIIMENDPIALMITPEGTRGYRDEWKSGFYHVAKKANVPVVLGYMDFEKKTAGVGGIVHLSDDMDADMRKIMAFYKDIKGKHPERFSIDKRYV